MTAPDPDHFRGLPSSPAVEARSAADPAPAAQPVLLSAPPASHRRRRSAVRKCLLVLTGVAATVLVVCLLAAVGLPLLRSAQAARQASRTQVALPATAGGLIRVDDGPAAEIARRAASQASQAIPGWRGAAYRRSGSTEPVAVVWAVRHPSARPQREVTAFFTGARQSAPIVEIRSYAAGPLGGRLQCGRMDQSGQLSGVCVVADNGAVIGGIMPGSSPAEAAALLLALRPDIERRD